MKNIHEIKYEIKGDVWTEAIEKAWSKVSKKVKIDGFRDGKVPRNVYEEKYGKTLLYQEATEGLLNTIYDEILKDNNLVPVMSPDVNILDYNDELATVVFTITTAPEVVVNEYKNLGVEKEDDTISDEELEAEFNKILTQYTELVIKEGNVVEGDTAVIDYVGKKDGVEFEGGKAENYELKIGSNSFIPGFEDAVVGMGINETKDINLKFPEEYPSEDLKGQDVVFTVTVNEIKEEKMPELDEEFFLDLGMDDVKTEAELKSFIKENLSLRKTSEVENKFIDDLLKKIGENVEIDIPSGMIDEEVNRIFREFNEKLSMQHLSIEDYFKWTNSNEETLKETVKPEATDRVKSRLILDEIIKQEKIEATDEEIDKRIDELAIHYHMTKEDLLKEFEDKSILTYEVKIKKVVDFLKENN